jgi:hypothetical protein
MSTWIFGEERIPQNDRHVLVTDGRQCFVAYFEDVDWVDAQTFDPFETRITHWMELPELPRRERTPQEEAEWLEDKRAEYEADRCCGHEWSNI